ncbi:class I SAM-dependent methyltransferase [Halopiger goleimassiliensis]|uniref:class I SAM-dependent methyltransferase n=1 Tax=Halopiger goleimassiliensis TaxID=1293048 RepID=UPI0006782D5D|nr:class I SAM-dependent methyltransferase [Halopiger goleimassiliensis]
MGFHTYPIDRADALEDPSRYRYCSREELLELLAPTSDAVVADLGSGTGFYSRDVAPCVGTLYAVDVQAAMHERHREAGIPANVEPVTAGIDALPFEDDELDAAFSTMSHHEYAADETMAELARVIRPDGRLVTVDWSADGAGEDGPPIDERFGVDEVVSHLEGAGFAVERAHDRPETLAVLARR